MAGTEALRRPLRGLEGCSHAGLCLHRYLPSQEAGGEKKDRDSLLQAVAKTPVPEPYKAAFKRWSAATPDSPSRVVLDLPLATPMAAGLGNDTVLETGLTLHHTYGVPVIPGSAVKGLCRRVARKANVAAEPMKALFGDTSSAGYCCFHDAWYVPGSGGGEPLFVDVITPHHPNYQTGRERQWPTDFDDPNPVHHLAVKPGVRFRFVVDIGPMRELEAAKALVSGILRYAVSEEGVGGKTSSGYGFFQADKAAPAANGAGAIETVVYRGADIFVQPRNEFKVRLSDRKTMIGPCQAPGLDIKKDQKGVNVTIKIDGRMKTIIKVEPAGS